jgi:AcrR family transcriptional regulator
VSTSTQARKRRSDGERSRNAILGEAVRLAAIEGIEGLSISRLATAVGMSKSGLFAHFGSKEELQLATIDRASAFFQEQVIDPAAAAPTAAERLRELVERYLHWVEASSPGGCFFASLVSEMDTHPGAVRDRAVQFLDDWLGLLESSVREAQADGALDPGEDSAQLAFELEAFLFLANAQFVASGGSKPLERARAALERRLAAGS